MIGIGKWEFDVNTFFYKGRAVIEISDNNGKYGFNAKLTGMQETPTYYVSKVEEQGNTLSLTCGSETFPNKEVDVVATFEGNNCKGYIKVPVLGKIALEGIKID